MKKSGNYFITGFEPVVHQWKCEDCRKQGIISKWTITIKPKNPMDQQRLALAELQVSKHVIDFGHSIIHKTKNEVIKFDL